MNTFMPYNNFQESAKCLDTKRLGKQRLEVLQIYNALIGKSKGWVNHPATKMWYGHQLALLRYGITCCLEWRLRGFIDNLGIKLMILFNESLDITTIDNPIWISDPKSISGYRSNLLRKDFKYYSKFGWTEPNNLPYTWGGGEIMKIKELKEN